MKVAFITRSGLYTVPGGDTVQITETAEELRKLNIRVRVFLSHEKINYRDFDLLHFFNLIRPADILGHTVRSNTPYVLSPVLVDYTEYDKNHRSGFPGWVLRNFSSPEYIKAVSRWLLLKDKLPAKQYLWKGHRRSILQILEKAKWLLPNSGNEYQKLQSIYQCSKPYSVIPNGINEAIFRPDAAVPKDDNLVVCAARIEGIKNQVNLIRALNNTAFTLVLIGDAAPNQQGYFKRCRQLAGSNIIFTGRLTQKQVADYLKRAKVHVLPSWFETCGLSSLEAAASGCNIVVTDRGFTRDYFGDEAFYCDPGNTNSIYNAIAMAAKTRVSTALSEKIRNHFTWAHAARETLNAYTTGLTN